MATAMGDVSVQPGSAVGRLGEDAAAAEAAAAAAKAAEVSGDPKGQQQAKPDDKAGEQQGQQAAELTPEQKAEAVTAAEKAVTEAKTPEEKAAAEAKLAELKGEKKAAGAPEKYEDFKLPDGMKLDDAALTEALPVFKELNLTQEQAQKLVDLQAKHVTAQAEAAIVKWNEHLEATTAKAKADPEIGGRNWEQSLGHAAAFIKTFGTPALQEYLNNAEAGSHPEIIRAFAKAGKAVSEDGYVPGKAAAEAPKSLAERMYPNHAK